MNTTSFTKIQVGDTEFNFEVRDYVGYDNTITDRVVLREVFEENTYQLHEDDFKGSGVFVDIGANVGIVSIKAHIVGAKRIIAVEPEPDNFKFLFKNIALNNIKTIETIHKAVWNENVKLPIVSGMQGATTSDERELKKHERDVIYVDTITIEELLKDIPEIDVLKCDTEGAEYKIMTNPEINKKAKKIVIEYHNTTIDQIGKLLATLVLTHNIQAFGDWRNNGGQIFALRYD